MDSKETTNIKPENPNSRSRQIPLTCSGHTRPVVQLEISQMIGDKYYMISACKDGKPILRDGKTGDWIGTFLGHKGAVWEAKLSFDAKTAVTASADFTAKLWSAITGDILYSFSHKHIVRTTTLNSDATKMLTGGHEKFIRLFDLKEPEKEAFEFPALDNNIKGLVWDDLNSLIFSSGEDQIIRIWDSRTNSLANQIELANPVSSMSISMDGQTLECTAGKEVSFWDLKSLNLVKKFEFAFDASSVSLQPEIRSRFVVGGASDLWVRTFDFETGEELEVYKGHHGPVHSVSYSPDGEIYATGSEDGTIRLWQTNPGKPYGLWELRGEGDNSTSTNQTEETIA